MPRKQSPLTPMRTDQEKSLQWYRAQIRKLGFSGMDANQAMKTGIGKRTTKLTVGRMYLFMYDAKHKDTLPYWDRFPLVFPFQPNPFGFTGINFHYLPPLLRVRLLDELMSYSTAQVRLTETTRLRLSWRTLKKFSAVQPCVKSYLTGHIRTSFMEINPNDWKTALLLPMEDFVGATKDTVFKHSKGVI